MSFSQSLKRVGCGPVRSKRNSRRFQLTVESVESRLLLSTITVVNVNDSGPGSLRQAILAADAATTPATIDFKIPGTGPETIKLHSALPLITKPVTIDGTSQPGYSGSPLIVLSGSGAGSGASGLSLTASAAGSVIRGLAIDSFSGVGVLVNGGSKDVVANDDIGITPAGLAAGNGTGVEIEGGAVHVSVSGDVISANTYGVVISGAGTSANVVAGDFIGTDAKGLHALPNFDGVVIQAQASNNTIGGTTLAARDVISGNSWDGVHIVGSGTKGNVVLGDDIGVASSGTGALGNGASDVAIFQGASSNTVGGTSAGARNVISAAGVYGVYISDAGTNGNVVEGNFIGTDASGSISLGNAANGVIVQAGATNTTIGGTVAGSGNVISGNRGYGILIKGVGTEKNVVAGNLIGTNAAGSASAANSWGVFISAGATFNTIGGTSASARNTISGNAWTGLELNGQGTSSNTVENNFIGLDKQGTLGLANPGAGVAISGGASGNFIENDLISDNLLAGVWINGSSANVISGDVIGLGLDGSRQPNGIGVEILGGSTNNTVGGTTAAARDVISANGQSGVLLTDPGTTDNVVEGDFIGTDTSGTLNAGNTAVGVFITNGASMNTIGGTTAAARCVISGNGADGVRISGSGTNFNVVEGDAIGVNVNGSSSSLGNGAYGVVIESGAENNTIGSTVYGAGDVISANAASGVLLVDSGTDFNVVEGDMIGLDSTGEFAIRNGVDGVDIASGAQFNTVGGGSYATRNIISGNTYLGVWITGAGTDDNAVEGNYIGVDKYGGSPLGNSLGGVQIDSGASFNVIGGSNYNDMNIISYNGGYGVGIGPGSDQNAIEDDIINLNQASGVLLEGSFNSVIGCEIEANGGWGILIAGQSDSYANDMLFNNIDGSVG